MFVLAPSPYNPTLPEPLASLLLLYKVQNSHHLPCTWRRTCHTRALGMIMVPSSSTDRKLKGFRQYDLGIALPTGTYPSTTCPLYSIIIVHGFRGGGRAKYQLPIQSWVNTIHCMTPHFPCGFHSYTRRMLFTAPTTTAPPIQTNQALNTRAPLITHL